MKKILGLFVALTFVFGLSACELSDQVNQVNVLESSIFLEVNDTYMLEVVVLAEPATYVQFTSQNTDVATVSEQGLVTAVAKGTTSIQVRAGNGFDYVVVHVDGGSQGGSQGGSDVELEEAYVVTSEAELLEAFNLGIYQITLGANIVMTSTYELSSPFEILFDDYTFEIDVTFGDDFYGGLAFYNETEGSLLSGTIDFENRIVPVNLYFNQVDRYGPTLRWDPETFLAYSEYDFLHRDYLDTKGKFPIASVEDLEAIDSREPHVFAKGTPYEIKLTSTGENETYILVNDIVGQTDVLEAVYAVTFEASDDIYLYTVDWTFISNMPSFRFHPGYAYIDDIDASTIPLVELDAYALNNLVVSSVRAYDKLALETGDFDHQIKNGVFIGNEYTIRYLHLDTPIFSRISNSIFSEVNFRNIYSTGAESIFAGSVGGDFVTFNDIDFNDSYMFNDGDNGDTAIFIGTLSANNATLVDVDMFFIYLFTENTDSGLIIGEIDGAANVSIFASDISDVMVESTNSEFGLVAGDVNNAVVSVNEFSADAITIYIEENDLGTLFGEISNDSYVTISRINLDEINLQSSDEVVGGVVGRISASYVEIFNFEFDNSTLFAEDGEIGGVVGRMTSNANVRIYDADIAGVNISSGDARTGGIVGSIDYSNLDIQSVVNLNGTIQGRNDVGGLIGLITSQSDVSVNLIKLLGVDIDGRDNVSFGIARSEERSTISASQILVNTSLISSEGISSGFISYISNTVLVLEGFFFESTNIGGDYASIVVGQTYGSTIQLSNVSSFDLIVEASDTAGAVLYADSSVIKIHNYESQDNVFDAASVQAGLVLTLYFSSLEVNNIYIDRLILITPSATAGLVFESYESHVSGYVRLLKLNPTYELTLNVAQGRLFGLVERSFVDLSTLQLVVNYLNDSVIYSDVEGSPYISTVDLDSVITLQFLNN